jgi:hypothetical protein
MSNNIMASHYHPGAYGKAVQGKWSCCKEKEKTAQGCNTTTRGRSQSQSAVDFYVHDYEDDDDDDNDNDVEVDETVSPLSDGGTTSRSKTKPCDTKSVRSEGIENNIIMCVCL